MKRGKDGDRGGNRFLKVYKKERSYYTEERVANARKNIAIYSWAKDIADRTIEDAEAFLTRGHEWIWSLVTSQKLPRSYGVNQTMGCPVCGKDIDRFGNYPYLADSLENPWKLVCPNCRTVFPSNDFGAYYRSGLDERGCFDPELADRSLLRNTMYPERGDDWCVDDGYGWLDPGQDDPETRRYTFIAYYNHWFLWCEGSENSLFTGLGGLIPRMLQVFGDAFLYTGDSRYAVAGTILLDRVAEVYPEMNSTVFLWKDGFRNSHGRTGIGKVLGCEWETGLVKVFCRSYDALFPGMEDPRITEFSSRIADQFRRGLLKLSPADIRCNIERGIILPVKSTLENGQVRGNVGMHQSALALAAVVLDCPEVTKEWVEYIFATCNKPLSGNGNMLKILVDEVDRDGHGNEASPAYNGIWLKQVKLVADVLREYRGDASFDLYRHPKFRKMFYMLIPLVMLGAYTPSIGDTKKAGNPGVIGWPDTYVDGFARIGDPLLAQFAHFLNGFKVEGLHGGMFADNESLQLRIRQVIETHGAFDPASTNLTGFGLAALRDGSGEASRTLTLYYGRNTGHGHRDTLNLGIYAFGLDLAPDHGYPSFADANFERMHWTKNTLSHNTIMVNRSQQASQEAGIPRHFEGTGRVKLIDVEAPNVYPETKLYRRTVAMVAIDETDSYIVDFFRVKGGEEHLYSFHGAEGEVTAEGLQLVKQPEGTYAGREITYADRAYDQQCEDGFNYLDHVERDGHSQTGFSLDWKIRDTWKVHPEEQNIHLRLTMLTASDEVALANGNPPQNKPGNPASFKYMLARRTGLNLQSQFVSLIEAYRNNRKVLACAEVPVQAVGRTVDSNDVFALKIVLQDGRIDYVMNALNPNIAYTVDGRFAFQGIFGFLSLASGRPVYAYMSDGTLLADEGGELLGQGRGCLTGRVVAFTKEMSAHNEITVKLDGTDELPELTGRFVYIQNDGVRNACYEIKAARTGREGTMVLEIGDATTIRSWVNAEDFSLGYAYDLAEGAELRIPLAAEWRAEERRQ